jgi:hypothetical protein
MCILLIALSIPLIIAIVYLVARSRKPNDLRVATKSTTVVRHPEMVFYENTRPRYYPDSYGTGELTFTMFDDYDSLIQASLRDIASHVVQYDSEICEYCGSAYHRMDAHPLILVNAFPATVYRSPPSDAKDLHIIERKGWMGWVQTAGFAIECSECNHKIVFRPIKWWQTASSGGSDVHRDVPPQFPGKRIT